MAASYLPLKDACHALLAHAETLNLSSGSLLAISTTILKMYESKSGAEFPGFTVRAFNDRKVVLIDGTKRCTLTILQIICNDANSVSSAKISYKIDNGEPKLVRMDDFLRQLALRLEQTTLLAYEDSSMNIASIMRKLNMQYSLMRRRKPSSIQMYLHEYLNL